MRPSGPTVLELSFFHRWSEPLTCVCCRVRAPGRADCACARSRQSEAPPAQRPSRDPSLAAPRTREPGKWGCEATRVAACVLASAGRCLLNQKNRSTNLLRIGLTEGAAVEEIKKDFVSTNDTTRTEAANLQRHQAAQVV